MIDLGQLNEALDSHDRLDAMMQERYPEALPALLPKTIRDAARAYADLLTNGEELEPWMIEDAPWFGWALPVEEDGRYLVIRLSETNTFNIAVTNKWAAIKDLHPGKQRPDRWVEVPSRSSGVPGLIITARWFGREGWVITHIGTGRVLGDVVYPTIAAARRAAKRIADLVDWTDPELIYDWIKPSYRPRRQAVLEALRAVDQ